MKRYLITTLALLFSSLSWASNGYDYPIDDALAATVVGTPKDYVADLPMKIRRSEKKVVVFPDREVKKFIPRKALNYTLVRQNNVAPLVFAIAGTGPASATTIPARRSSTSWCACCIPGSGSWISRASKMYQ